MLYSEVIAVCYYVTRRSLALSLDTSTATYTADHLPNMIQRPKANKIQIRL
jgi:hypothetical protein